MLLHPTTAKLLYDLQLKELEQKHKHKHFYDHLFITKETKSKNKI